MIFGRKVLLDAITMVSDEPFVIAFCGIALFQASLLLHVAKRPYRDNVLNTAETFSMLFISGTFFCGALLSSLKRGVALDTGAILVCIVLLFLILYFVTIVFVSSIMSRKKSLQIMCPGRAMKRLIAGVAYVEQYLNDEERTGFREEVGDMEMNNAYLVQQRQP